MESRTIRTEIESNPSLTSISPSLDEAELPLHRLLDKELKDMTEPELREFVGRLRSARLSHQTFRAEAAREPDVSLDECEVSPRKRTGSKPKIVINIEDYV